MSKQDFDALKVTLASPEQIEEWSHGAIDNPDTINYRTGKPKMKGLFCESIF
jgi:DNA-directed RNA polymerase subunit beta'